MERYRKGDASVMVKRSMEMRGNSSREVPVSSFVAALPFLPDAVSVKIS